MNYRIGRSDNTSLPAASPVAGRGSICEGRTTKRISLTFTYIELTKGTHFKKKYAKDVGRCAICAVRSNRIGYHATVSNSMKV